MQELAQQIPLGCRSCHIFSDDIMSANELENTKWAIQTQREKLSAQDLEDVDLDLQEAHTDMELAVLNKRR